MRSAAEAIIGIALSLMALAIGLNFNAPLYTEMKSLEYEYTQEKDKGTFHSDRMNKKYEVIIRKDALLFTVSQSNNYDDMVINIEGQDVKIDSDNKKKSMDELNHLLRNINYYQEYKMTYLTQRGIYYLERR